jgi:hypothetical protein
MFNMNCDSFYPYKNILSPAVFMGSLADGAENDTCTNSLKNLGVITTECSELGRGSHGVVYRVELLFYSQNNHRIEGALKVPINERDASRSRQARIIWREYKKTHMILEIMRLDSEGLLPLPQMVLIDSLSPEDLQRGQTFLL